MTLDALLKEAAPRLSGFTLYPSPGKGWQAAARVHGSSFWKIGIDADVNAAVEAALRQVVPAAKPAPVADVDLFA